MSIGLASAVAFKMGKNSDEVQKLFSKWGKLDRSRCGEEPEYPHVEMLEEAG